MKKITAIVLALAFSVIAYGQAQITTKKVKIEDFMEKTIKVVTSGNMFFDQALKDEVMNRWRISPFEFCTLEEFETLKTDDSYYFMLVTKDRFKREKEAGLAYISILKGGPAAEKGLNRMLNVVSIPIMSVKNPSGREFIVLPAILDILQVHITRSMEKDLVAYGGLGNYTMNISSTDDMNILFVEEDLSDEITEDVRNIYFKNGMMSVDMDTADMAMEEYLPRTIVSFTVAPDEAGKGSYCYKMLIDAKTHNLYYFRKHRITKRFGKGFLLEDINRIATSR